MFSFCMELQIKKKTIEVHCTKQTSVYVAAMSVLKARENVFCHFSSGCYYLQLSSM